MLRPATPLMIFFFVAFILLLLSTISAPIVASIPLGTDVSSPDNHVFYYGVFGYCDNTQHVCSTIRLGEGYNPKNVTNRDYAVPLSRNRAHQLSNLLVVHLIAAILSFICAAMAASAHFRSPAHSPRFLLTLLIVSFPTLFVALLAFLVDILLFFPHVGWGGWVALVATIILTSCTVLTCAMRRTLVNRKAREQRIAENAEMNGENYLAQRSDHEKQFQMRQIGEDQLGRAETPPPLQGKSMTSDVTEMNRQPQFAAFEYQRPRPSTDDRTPLNAAAPSQISPGVGGRPEQLNGGMQVRDGLRTRGNPGEMSRGERIRDDLPPSPVSPIDDEAAANFSARRGPVDPRFDPRRGGRGGPVPPYGGRGGAPPPMYGRGRGAYPPRGYGPPRGRGMNPPPVASRGYYRGGGPSGMGQSGPPPPGWYNDERDVEMGDLVGGGAAVAAGAGAMMSHGERPPPPGYRNGCQSDGAAPYPSRSDVRPYTGSQSSKSGRSQGFAYGNDPQGRSVDARQQQQPPPDQQQSPDLVSRTTPGRWLSNDSPNRRPSESASLQNQRHETFGALDDPSPSQSPPVPGYHSNEQAHTQQTPSPPQQQQPQPQPQQRQARPAELIRSPDSFGFSGRRPSPIQNSNSPRNYSPPPPMPPPINTQNLPRQGYDVDAASSRSAPGRTRDSEQESTGGDGFVYNHSRGDVTPTGLDSEMRDRAPSSWQDQTKASVTSEPRRLAGSPNAASEKVKTYGRRTSSDAYYEDVSPRFATDEHDNPPFPLRQAQQSGRGAAAMPSSLMPGHSNYLDVSHTSSLYSDNNANDPSRNESRSPAASETSNFTSISQRAINPNWQPPPSALQPGGPPPPPAHRGYGGSALSGRPPAAFPASQRWNEPEDVLSSNPDFVVPGPGNARPGHLRGMSGSHHYPDPL